LRRRGSTVTGQTRKVVFPVSSPLTGQTVAAAVVAQVIVLATTRPALTACIGYLAIGKPDDVVVPTVHARIIGRATPIDAILVVQRAAPVIVGGCGRGWHGRRSGEGIWRIGGIERRGTTVAGQARKVVSIFSELAGQTITADTVVTIVVFSATCPAIATVTGWGTIRDPTNVRGGAAHTRLVGITAPIDALFVVMRTASVVVRERSREGHGRAGGFHLVWAVAAGNRTKVREAFPVGRFLFASVGGVFRHDPFAFFLSVILSNLD
jgi:hypothetical protein